jgi:hypothetical protein
MPQSRSVSRRGAPREPEYVTHRIGRLVVTLRPTPIYAQPSTRSAVLYPQTPAQFFLMMTRQQGDWCGVLMNNGSVGWVPRRVVQLTPYDVVYTLPRGADPAHVTRLAMRYSGRALSLGRQRPAHGDGLLGLREADL